VEKRFQVFVSSTQQGCTPEKKEVIEALLELDCLPCSNDYFTSPEGPQSALIQKMIDDADFFILIIGNDESPADGPWINKVMAEYEYAVSRDKPVTAFIYHNDTSQRASGIETNATDTKQFKKFKKELIDTMAILWSKVPELGALVSRLISQGRKYFPQAGWVRANMVHELVGRSKLSSNKYIRTRERDGELVSTLTEAPMEDLAEGDEQVEVYVETSGGPYNKPVVKSESFTVSWKTIAYHLLPKVMDPIRESTFRTNLNTIFRDIYLQINRGKSLPGNFKVLISNETFDAVKIQFHLLGFIRLYSTEIEKEEGVTTTKMVSLTERGRQKLIGLRAVRKTGI
jgi:hypothetical protein